jgi:ABC-type branched-subunit amino acid transport system substrate-binding protein
MAVRDQVRELVEDRVMAIVGPVAREASGVAVEAAARYGVPIVRFSVAGKEPRKEPWAFRAFLSRRSQSDALVAYARESGVRRVLVLQADTAYGMAVSEAFVQASRAAGLAIEEVLSIPAEQAEFTRWTGTVQEKRFDAVFVGDRISRAGLVLRFLARRDIRTQTQRRRSSQTEAPNESLRYVRVLGPSEWLTAGVPSSDSQYLRGAVIAVEWPGLAHAGVRSFVAAARAAFEPAPGVFEAVGYDAIRVLQSASADSRDTLREQLRRTAGFDGVLGRVVFDEAGEPIRESRLFRAGRSSFTPVE